MSKIKARVPLAYRPGAAAERMRAMNLLLIYTGFVLFNDFEFTDDDLGRYLKK